MPAPTFAEDAVKSALVLGGGGTVGYAWECGVLAGLAETFDPCAFDAFLGTSAGAIAGCQLAGGSLPKPAAKPEQNRTPSFPEVDMQLLARVFSIWSRIQHTTTEQTAAIGKIARELPRQHETTWIATVSAMTGVKTWPSKRLFISAVDAESGERRAFDRSSGADIARVVAASASIPGRFPCVEIEGRFYMDGQVYSSTHADLLAPYAPLRVAILVPTNKATGGAIGGQAERMLEQEVELLRSKGCEVTIKTPSSEDATRIGGNGLMDAKATPEAYAVGLETGRQWGSELL